MPYIAILWQIYSLKRLVVENFKVEKPLSDLQKCSDFGKESFCIRFVPCMICVVIDMVHSADHIVLQQHIANTTF